MHIQKDYKRKLHALINDSNVEYLRIQTSMKELINPISTPSTFCLCRVLSQNILKGFTSYIY